MESKKRERRRLRAPSSFRMFGEGGWGLCLSNVNRRSSLALLQSFFLPRVPFHVGFEPAQDALPAFAMVGCRREVAAESFLANSHKRAGAGFLGAAWMQSVNGVRLEFPANNRLGRIVTADPGVDEKARRIDF